MIEKLNTALKDKGFWSQENFTKYLSLVHKSIQGSIIDWDGPEENWASILVNNKPVLFLSFLYPLIIVLANYKPAISDLPEELRAVFIDDFDFEFIDPSEKTLVQAFEKHSIERLKSLKKDLVSVNDLWWATIT